MPDADLPQADLNGLLKEATSYLHIQACLFIVTKMVLVFQSLGLPFQKLKFKNFIS